MEEFETVVLVTGGRGWSDREKIREVLTEFDPLTTLIVEGGCRGADDLAKQEAEKLGFKVLTVHADWYKYGKAAGVVRNKLMYETTHPNVVLAFHSDLKNSKGTKHMVEMAKKGGTPVRLTV